MGRDRRGGPTAAAAKPPPGPRRAAGEPPRPWDGGRRRLGEIPRAPARQAVRRGQGARPGGRLRARHEPVGPRARHGPPRGGRPRRHPRLDRRPAPHRHRPGDARPPLPRAEALGLPLQPGHPRPQLRRVPPAPRVARPGTHGRGPRLRRPGALGRERGRHGRDQGGRGERPAVARARRPHLEALRDLPRPEERHSPPRAEGARMLLGRAVVPGQRGGDRLPRRQPRAHTARPRRREQHVPLDRREEAGPVPRAEPGRRPARGREDRGRPR